MVKIQYIPTTDADFRSLLDQANSIKNLKGSGSVQDISYFQNSSPYIRGSGWFGRVALPLFKKYVVPCLLDLGSKVLGDVQTGQKFKSSLKRRGIESLNTTAKRILTGQGKNRRRSIKRLKHKSCHSKIGFRSKCKKRKNLGGKSKSKKRKKVGGKSISITLKKRKRSNKSNKKRLVKKGKLFHSKKRRPRKFKRKKCIYDPTFDLYN